MKMYNAFLDTLGLAKERGYDDIGFDEVGVDYDHLQSMIARIDMETFDEGKLGRWLGYIQGVLVANECLTLDEVKAINMKWLAR